MKFIKFDLGRWFLKQIRHITDTKSKVDESVADVLSIIITNTARRTLFITTDICWKSEASRVMPRTIYHRRDLLNSNYLYQPPSDESPVIVRDQCLDECTLFDGDVAVRTDSEKPSPSPTCSQNVSKREKFMLFAILFLGILAIVFIALFVSKIGKQRSGLNLNHPSRESVIVAAGKCIVAVPLSNA